MMTLRVIGTGSSGNAYVLSDEDNNVLILDAGIKARQIFAAIDSRANVCGCVVTHEHLDHSRAVFDLAFRGVRIGMSDGTRVCIKAQTAVNVEALRARQTYLYGVYKVKAFEVEHDAVEPFGFLIEHTKTHETVLYATDTYYLRYRFANVTYWIVECNYIDDCLHETNEALRHRLLTSHMSLRRLEQALQANDLSYTSRIVIVHLSDSRSDERRMVQRLQDVTEIETIAARAGETIVLDTEVF